MPDLDRLNTTLAGEPVKVCGVPKSKKDEKMKTILILAMAVMLTACSGHVAPPEVKLGKKCTVSDDGSIVYSYVWFHKKGTELSATAEACDQLK